MWKHKHILVERLQLLLVVVVFFVAVVWLVSQPSSIESALTLLLAIDALLEKIRGR